MCAMRPSVSKRILCAGLVLCLLLSLVPVFQTVEANAVSGIDSLTCSGFISNSTAQTYIDVMMRYYLNNNSKLRTTLDDGLSVVFMFEGGSDYYWSGNDYNNSAYDVRDQAVVIVVQKNSSGNAYIDFYSENCSSIPGDPSWCTGAAYSGSTTILDGIYPFYTTNHTGPYAALQLDMSATNGYGYYTPSSDPDGFKNGCSGINVHTRASDIAAGSDLGWAWSEGCQVIGSGSTSSNVFNSFMQSVCGISWYPWIDYYASPKNLNTFAYTGTHMGYYVVDRQLGLMNNSGTEYGSGSLTALYTKTALNNITAYSTDARANADFNVDYFERCTYYPSHCQIQPTHDSSINTYPCADGTNGSVTFEKADPNKYYTCTGVYKNHADNYWWEVISSSGEVGYMYGESARYNGTFTSGITLSGVTAPNGHVQGNTFSLSGTVRSEHCELTEVSVWVHSGFDREGVKITGDSVTPSGSTYTLKGSTIDSNTVFDQLPAGKYTYVIRAGYNSYFISDDYRLMYAYGTKDLMSQYFVVVPTAVSQSSCSHSYVNSVLVAASCTGNGSGVKYCSLCGILTTETIDAYGHQWTGQTTVAPSCTQDGYQHRICSACGCEEKTTLPATGHDSLLSRTEGTCIQRAGYAHICQTCGHTEPVDLSVYQSQWSETVPEGFDRSLFATRMQYRHREIGSTVWSEWYDGVALNEPDQEVQTRTLYRMKAGAYGAHSWDSGVCTLCGKSCEHSYENNYCSVCGYREPDQDLYLFGYINGENYACEEDADSKGVYKFVDGRLVVTFTERSYVAVKTGDNRVWYMADGYPGDDAISVRLYPTEVTGERSDKLSVPRGREITFTIIENVDGTLTLWYVASQCDHDWLEGVCQTCDQVCQHMVWTNGKCSSCDLICEHGHWTEGVCDRCALQCDHSYENDLCTLCGFQKPPLNYYLFGYINGRDYGCEADYRTMGEYLFVDGHLTVTFITDSYVAVKTTDNQDWYMTDRWLGTEVTGATLYNTADSGYEKLFVPGGKILTFHLTDNADGTLDLRYEIAPCPHVGHTTQGVCIQCGISVGHLWNEVLTEATCVTPGFLIRTCYHCGKSESQRIPTKGHRMADEVMSPTCSLSGYTTHTCTVCGYSYTDRQVPPNGHTDVEIDAQKPTCTTAGSIRYQCAVCGYQHTETVPASHSYTPTTTAPTCTTQGFTVYLCDCGDGYVGSVTAALGHQYRGGLCTLCGEEDPDFTLTIPTLTLKAPSLEFRDMIRITAFYTAENIQDVVEMGMITYSTEASSVSVDTAEHVIPGATYEEGSGRYYSCSQGIHGKYLGDTVYLAIYARLSDGSYVYTRLVPYSPVQYATGQLKNSTDMKLKQLVVAMLNYGAEAQRYFGHNTDALANASLTAEQKALSESYHAEMIQAVPSASEEKQGIFANNEGFTSRKPAISFEDAFCINYFFTPRYAPDSSITLYYWNAEDYSAAQVLTTSNATGKLKLKGVETGEYRGDITGISAKALSEAVYVAAAYRSGGTVWTSGVLGYSIGAYCGSQASKGGSIADLAMATAVYGYHAKQYFG